MEGPDDDWGGVDAPPDPPIRPAPAYLSDRTFYRIVAGSLALVAIASILGSIAIVLSGGKVPDSIVALGSTAAGALAGVLASTRL